MSCEFKGFSEETLSFLVELGFNNNKVWLESNRQRYRKVLLDPFKALVRELAPFMERIDPFFQTTAAVGKTISRLNRDVRFNRGKPPYRTNMWITFKVPSPQWRDSPGFFFELFPDKYRYGMGFYEPSRETMKKILAEVETDPEKFLEETALLRRDHFQIQGERYKRTRFRTDTPRELRIWYQLKDFYTALDREIDGTLFSSELTNLLCSEFESLSSLYDYLWEIKLKREVL